MGLLVAGVWLVTIASPVPALEGLFSELKEKPV